MFRRMEGNSGEPLGRLAPQGARLDLAERGVPVESRLAGKPQDALAERIALDLVGAAGDRGDTGVEIVEREAGAKPVALRPRDGGLPAELDGDLGAGGLDGAGG